MLQALIFDFDGLILDTETPCIEAWAQVHAHFGIPCPREKALQLVGHVETDFEAWGAFPSTQPREPLDVLEKQLRTHLVLAQPVLPGVRELLTAAQQAGLRLGVASNASHPWVDHHLDRLGLIQFFDTVCCRDDVREPKPAPEIYQLAAQRLGVAPAETAAFEDSPPGSMAAKLAGLTCVVVPNPCTRHHAFPHADLILPSLAGLTLETLHALRRR